jgi:2-polyprenyl-3-methyl-5-hydroxy-6-metoxy-1,4-benzoquinol methylase
MDLFLNFDMNIFQENRKYWDQRVAVHVESEFYDVASWKGGKSSLNPPELELLPANLKDVRILHLMCHFGQDSISLSRMGARVTGVDFSSKAIIQAKSFAEELGQTTKFVQSNLYELEEHSLGEYDIVYMSYGTLLWLDDLPKWAQIVAKHLKPYGKLILVDFHPVCSTVGDDGDRKSVV